MIHNLIFNTRTMFVAGILLLFAARVQASDKVYVDDFGAIVNDSTDDAPAIREAIQFAKDNGLKHIVFGAGTYYIKSTAAYPGYGYRHIGFVDMDSIIVEGAKDENGDPATLMLRHNPARTDGSALPSIFFFKNCENVVFKNFAIDNDPAYCTAGIVTGKGSDYLEVEIFEGNPVIDGSPCYTANAWDLGTKTLKKVPSLTFGSSPASWQRLGDESSRTMRIDGVDFTRYLDEGDGISWHLGSNGKQIQFDYCRDIHIKNIITYNTAGFAMETINCKNVTGKKVVFKTKGNQLSLGSRDAWKIAWCSGEISVDKMYVEGVRWDGQNIHGTFLYVDELLSAKQLRMFKASGTAPILETGSKLGFWNGNEVEPVTIAGWNYEGKVGTRQMYTIDLEEDVPSSVAAGSFATVYSLNADHYTLTNSTFRNIAGCASVIKQENVVIDHCTFDHIMYPPVVLGAEKSGAYWLEGTFPRNVSIRNNTFAHSGWVERIGLYGSLGVGYRSDEGQNIRNITIEDNTFRNSKVGINLQNCDSVYIHDNEFIDIGEPTVIEESTTGYIVVGNNTGSVSGIPLYNSSAVIDPSLDGYLKYNRENLVASPGQLELESHVNNWPRDIILEFDEALSGDFDRAYIAVYCKGVYNADRPETNPMYISGYAGDAPLAGISWSDTTLFTTVIDTIYKNQHEAPQWYIWDVTGFINTVAAEGAENFYFRIYSQSGSIQLYYFESLASAAGAFPALVLYEDDTDVVTCFEYPGEGPGAVNVYPNPFFGNVKIDYLLSESGPASLVIYNKYGVPVKQLLVHDGPDGMNAVDMETSDLPGGIYYCKLTSNGDSVTIKLLKH